MLRIIRRKPSIKVLELASYISVEAHIDLEVEAVVVAIGDEVFELGIIEGASKSHKDCDMARTTPLYLLGHMTHLIKDCWGIEHNTIIRHSHRHTAHGAFERQN